jgi:hypothetical protein
MPEMNNKRLITSLLLGSFCLGTMAKEGEEPVERHWVKAPDAPAFQTWADADDKSRGCVTCHTESDRKTMHASESVVLGCTDCHGGDASVTWSGKIEKPIRYDWVSKHKGGYPHHDPEGHGDDHEGGAESGGHGGDSSGSSGHGSGSGGKWTLETIEYPFDRPVYPEAYQATIDRAHVMPRYPDAWAYPNSANPQGAYALSNKEAPEFIRFNNPADLRIAREACGACHMPIIQAAERSIMATSAMLWGGAAYNNGILPFKRYILGEAYTREGKPALLKNPVEPDERMTARGILPSLAPLPTWQTIPPADVFRIFERGGRNIANLFPETGLPNALGQIQRLEEPGRPDIKQSNRGPATGNRVAIPALNIHKSRLNDPNMWFLGTNDNPGDFRHSGCAACHVPYANDRWWKHSGMYAKFGHRGLTQTADPTIPKDITGHPLKHEFTRAIPTAQCMNCHMHQPNMFINTYLGFIMWDYESDAPFMWPEEQQEPDHLTLRRLLDRNPEEAVIRGKWGDLKFLEQVSELNPQLKDTQFADYHGHGWNFRGIFKRDRVGNLLDADGDIVENDDPEKWDKAVHMASIHADVGMHCVDCHFSQDSHSNGHIVGEVMAGVEIKCIDCHGTVDKYANLLTTGTMAPPAGNDLSLKRNPDGKKRFEWIEGNLIQRSLLNPGLEWEVSQLKDSVSPDHPEYNDKAARAKLVSNNTDTMEWGMDVAPEDRAHKYENMLCYTCHTSWTTSCAGCHLTIQSNWKTELHHYEGDTTRSYATYNPQVTRDQMFQLGKHGELKNGKIAPVRSSSALVLSSRNSNRELIYIQQPPISAAGFSSQAFAPHFPHTARKTETKTCTDCHLSEAKDNNAIMTQLLLLGTKFTDFLGYNAWVGGEKHITAVRVTEWEEPQAVIGSYLHRYAYPRWYGEHEGRNLELPEAYDHKSGTVGCIQHRGEYLFVADSKRGFEALDIASIANKGISQRIITAPFSPLGHDTTVGSENATCVALATTQPVHPSRNQGDLMRKINMEQPFHPIYEYAVVTDSVEGLYLVNIETLNDVEPRNNVLERAVTWNPGGVLNGARHLYLAGYWAYISTPNGVVVVSLDDPLSPKHVTTIPLQDARAAHIQFRYLFVTTAKGLEVVDVTHPTKPKIVEGALIPLRDANRLHLARTYAYVAAGSEGLAIIDITSPESPKMYMRYTADGQLNDARDVVVASTNASLYAYVADGKNGLKVVHLTAPDRQPNFYGYSPEPKPNLIAWYSTASPALSLSRGLERDRAVDETGNQMAIFGRIGSRPFTLEEMQTLYLDDDGNPWYVSDDPDRGRMATNPPADTSGSGDAGASPE